ncbi:tRNA (guanine-N7-)-methyltransferase subunit Trm82 [Coprinopsis cinerea okayama7|uniref:tRNA (Guanine-N7-)-methyltransferase subunit Trm82 n=1 Tax=Coprinopsis cinerea (strain Okayama-7 / 130 / ATCC MYA-4618 / FGSC 9003) TaxID=240176 RepID=A8N9H6_COPC7|nr:tRNA (guanine-N7-)-methyltransferase subunit Trm82 [Coprinopsis cinerea okayama7\|eukprot:XP_001831482.1 tRNA (guanine-N7-)-methyltransferase subunit Trm82 [Coprinopsis cinerea okayama7\
MATPETRPWPFTRVFYSPEKTVVVSGPHVLVFDSKSGELQRSTARLGERDQEDISKAGPIQCVAVDPAFKYVATVGDDKLLKIWELEGGDDVGGLKLFNSRELPKKPTGLLFTKDSQTILTSDKFGDVFSYPLVYVPYTDAEIAQQKADEAKDPYASHTNPSNGTLVLGHASPLNAMLLTHSADFEEKYIITADRDEHIRVSWYPQGYNVEMYCLGHRKFVSALHIPQSDPTVLVSGGGDPVLKVWDWMSGKQKGNVEVAEVVEPYIVVKKARWGDDGENDGEEGGETKRRGKKKKGKGKNKGKGKAEEEAGGAGGEEGESMAVDGTAGGSGATSEPAAGSEPQKVLAIRRISSAVDADGKVHYIFSAIGATAVFSFPSPEPSPENDPMLTTTISHFDFGKPVIDFLAVPSIAGDPALVFVVLDPSWTGNHGDGSSSERTDRVRLLAVSSSGLIQPPAEALARCEPLLKALNDSASDIPASEKDLKAFDLYSELVSLPKYVARGPEVAFSTKAAGEDSGAATPTAADGGLTKRELGRLKRITRVEETKAKVLGGGQSEAGAATPQDDAEGQPQLKRSKSESSEAS